MISAFYYDKGDFMPVQQDALVEEAAAFHGREAYLLAVCDGIGGMEEGEYVSGYVTMRLRNWFYDAYLTHIRKHHSRRRIKRDCYGMLYDCNRYFQVYGERYGVKTGTTMTMAVLWRRKYLVFHVGDSRAFILGRRCKKLTEDDCYEGNVLSRCIGSFPWRGVYFAKGNLRRRERLLVCSDGFWRRVKEKELLQSLGGRKKVSEEQLEKRLYKLGREGRMRGEKDNQAAVIVG